VEIPELGRQLRALRAASGRTVASVAVDAGLSVPYIANLENGRGNPTAGALSRLASALGMRLVISLEPADEAAGGARGDQEELPPGLLRLSRTTRFRATASQLASQLRQDPNTVAARLLNGGAAAGGAATGGAAAGGALGRDHDLAEADYWRLIDALILIIACPATSD
jgi:transcriptional regulator with XRE-family HTH domain